MRIQFTVLLCLILPASLAEAQTNRPSPAKVRIVLAGDSTMNDDKVPSTNPATPFDGTHLNAFGSRIIGAIVAQELKKAAPELAGYIR